MKMKSKNIRLFSDEFAFKHGKYVSSPFYTRPDLRWDEEQMDIMHDKIIDIIHEKLDNKVLVFRNSIIDLDRRVTKYAIIRKVDWTKKYKRVFHVKYESICIEDGVNPFIRLFTKDNDDSIFIEPLSGFEIIEMEDFKKMVDETYNVIKAKFFK